ncbi:hypothetical protein EDB86DRAFT_3243250 [Lactarius hatsudake]|nr:hypothetical protein EDB86DRAFT_3243250 [Lactarius hatsudake]
MSRAGTNWFLSEEAKNEDRIIGTAHTFTGTPLKRRVLRLQLAWKWLRYHLFCELSITSKLVSCKTGSMDLFFFLIWSTPDYYVACWQTLENECLLGDRKQSTTLQSRGSGNAVISQGEFSAECLTRKRWFGSTSGIVTKYPGIAWHTTTPTLVLVESAIRYTMVLQYTIQKNATDESSKGYTLGGGFLRYTRPSSIVFLEFSTPEASGANFLPTEVWTPALDTGVHLSTSQRVLVHIHTVQYLYVETRSSSSPTARICYPKRAYKIEASFCQEGPHARTL